MDTTFRVPLRIVFYVEDGQWVARCLEFNLIGAGKTREKAAELLAEAVATQIHACLKHRTTNLFTPAAGKYFQMFAAGKDVSKAELIIKRVAKKLEAEDLDGYSFDEMEAREYSDADLVCA
jgi:hypothetical protein